MTERAFTVLVPATSGNVGPGFDVLGLALSLWNETDFILPEEGEGWSAEIAGEGTDFLPRDASHLTLQAVRRVYEFVGAEPPRARKIRARNRIPVSSGLGSSASAVLAGLLGGNHLLGEPLSREQILALATEMEGHPDNAAPALWGGFTTAWRAASGEVRALSLPLAPAWHKEKRLAVVLPAVRLSTQESRAVLPKSVPRADAVFNLGRVVLLLEALRRDEPALLAEALQDRLHQPYRLPLIRGAEAALEAALEAGAWAVALSGAGPSIIAFAPAAALAEVLQAMMSAFAAAGVEARGFTLKVPEHGATVKLSLSA